MCLDGVIAGLPPDHILPLMLLPPPSSCSRSFVRRSLSARNSGSSPVSTRCLTSPLTSLVVSFGGCTLRIGRLNDPASAWSTSLAVSTNSGTSAKRRKRDRSPAKRTRCGPHSSRPSNSSATRPDAISAFSTHWTSSFPGQMASKLQQMNQSMMRPQPEQRAPMRGAGSASM